LLPTYKQKGFIAHDKDDTIVLFEEGKKNSKYLKDSVFIETSGLGHSMHSDELYTKISQFYSSNYRNDLFCIPIFSLLDIEHIKLKKGSIINYTRNFEVIPLIYLPN
jgi:hypothetical protein